MAGLATAGAFCFVGQLDWPTDSAFECRGPPSALANSAARESEVHELLAQGLTNEEIARQLYISLSTTKVHVKHIYEKLGVRSRLEAARALRDDV